ncbi:MAG: hypothetical protein PHV20_01740 [Bacteroidales bacterium]|nr:hypothetical protein [Bacteroidales bacterium]
MEPNAKIIETLLERAAEYGKTTYELSKLKALEKSSDLISTIIPHILVVGLTASFLLFLNIGLSLWLGEIIGKIYLGFFFVSLSYMIVALSMHFLFHKSIKRFVSNFFIKQILK